MKKLITALVCIAILASIVTVVARPLVKASYSNTETTVEEVSSPDNNVRIAFVLEEGHPYYNVSYDGRVIIENSSLGFHFENASPLDEGFEVVDVSRESVDNTWEPVWGDTAEVRDHYNQLTVKLKELNEPYRRMDLVFRAYNDGVGFRYVLPEQENLTSFEITSEDTEFRFSGDYTVWWAPGSVSSYEKSYLETLLSEVHAVGVGTEPVASTPITIEVDDNLYVCIHQAALIDYADMMLLKVNSDPPVFKSSLASSVVASTPRPTPWRVMIISTDPGGLIESHLILNLNDPCVLEDTSWIKPGKSTWNWLVTRCPSMGGDLGVVVDNYHYVLGTETIRRFIDLSDWLDFPYTLIDMEWYGMAFNPKTDPLTWRTDEYEVDIPYLLDYAKTHGVELGLYINTEAFMLHDADEMFSTYENWGVRYLKIGFLSFYYYHGQDGANMMSELIKTAAKYHLMIIVHESLISTGLERTYPNFVTREDFKGNEYVHISGFLPDHHVILPFTRMVAGPMDFTPGIFDLGPDSRFAFAYSTLAKQLALWVVYFSPIQHATDYLEMYQQFPGPCEFLRYVPTTWDETRVLNAKIGDYITIARRKGSEWYVGSLTDGEDRELEIPLDFLGDGVYVAQIYQDAPETDWETNPQAIEIKSEKVTSSDTIVAPLKSLGGQAIRIVPAPDVLVENLLISKETIEQGEPTTISVDVANISGKETTKKVELSIDGEVVDWENITLSPGESTIVTFTVSTDELGTHLVSIGDLSGTFTVVAPEQPSGLDIPISVVVVVVLVLIIGVGLFVRYRKRAS